MVKAGEEEEQLVYELQGEPAVVINGVPALNADLNECASSNTLDINSDACLRNNRGFGKALEGRVIRKMFSDQYYYGKVTEFDEETSWYRVDYEDGDFEDLEWHELEELLLPLDVSLSLKQVAMNNYRYDKSIFESGEAASTFQDRMPKALESTKMAGIIQEVTPASKKRGRPPKKSVHQEAPLDIEKEKRSRGRPPKKSVHEETPQDIEKSVHEETPQDIEKSLHEETPMDMEKSVHEETPEYIEKFMHQEAPQDIEKGVHQEMPHSVEKGVHLETPLNIEKRSRGRPRKNPKPEIQMQGEKSSPEKRPRGRPPKSQRGRPRITQPEIHVQHQISSAEHLLQEMELPVEVIFTEKGSS
ncbi:hypothetical protein H6P81_000674 [Aristolochia fimbriata]|uniref:PTM/DIR17-like Tudor domain-containing protein n=1 Tax=Aristolochia fimbriata TaxID=158543 RepID=A0AAV7F8N4_ARIFI|nr:hypothetical protein H6P81_000674 [Aristolochia fimbriata]